MKIQRLEKLLGKTKKVYGDDLEVEIGDGYISIIVDHEPTEDERDLVPGATYDPYDLYYDAETGKPNTRVIHAIRIWDA